MISASLARRSSGTSPGALRKPARLRWALASSRAATAVSASPSMAPASIRRATCKPIAPSPASPTLSCCCMSLRLRPLSTLLRHEPAGSRTKLQLSKVFGQLPKLELLDLARRSLWDLLEYDMPWAFVAGQMLAAPVDDIVRRRGCARLQLHERAGRLTPSVVRLRDNRCVGDRRMLVDRVLDLN